MLGSFWKQDFPSFRKTENLSSNSNIRQNAQRPSSVGPSLRSHSDRDLNPQHSTSSVDIMRESKVSDPTSPSMASTNALFEEFPLVDQCLNEASADKLERHCETAKSILGALRAPLNEAKDNLDASRFLKTIDHLKAHTESVRTIVGVVGDTGSGKSSVINAILDEEMLVPTNCMRACTAVITELSYNYSNDPAALYRAEVEFISQDDWLKELSQLFEDLLDATGDIVRDSSNTETDAGVAWAKIKAVYPQQTKEGFSKTTADTLANAPEVTAVLGKKQLINEATSEVFQERMQRFIDSDEKDGQQRKRGEKKQLEFWPLIKVVRIFTKAEALSTGAIIVDLPGVHDSNAARAAVADSYMKQCDTLWIVVPITRAVDDKTAQNLMGQTFKLQLKLDCKYSKLSFVCSKTDDILIGEAVKNLKLHEDVKTTQEQVLLAKSKVGHHEAEFDRIMEQRDDLRYKTEQLQVQIDEYQELADSFTKASKSSSSNQKKRKAPTRQNKSRKKVYIKLDDSSSDDEAKDEAENTIATSKVQVEKSLTEPQIRAELERMRAEKAHMLQTDEVLEDAAVSEKRAFRQSKKKLTVCEAQLKSLCIEGRNKYSTNAMRHDYARGAKEMDQEEAVLAGNDLFDPECDVRDYEAVGLSLPIFCVSSRAYQKGRGRLEMDPKVQGFPTLEHTGIPQLRDYAKELTAPDRVIAARKLLEDFKQVLHSLNLWSRDHGGEVQLSDVEKRDQVDKLGSDLADLRMTLHQAADDIIKECRDILTNHLYPKFDEAATAASHSAIETVERWFIPKADGGIPWNTYRATCVRDGTFHSKSCGHRDLNEELVTPLKRALVHSWERVFATRIPQTLDKFPIDFKRLLENFLKDVQERLQTNSSSASINMSQMLMLRVLLGGHTNSIAAILKTFRNRMRILQQTANRGFTPMIARNMADAYELCRHERGRNCFSRMKTTMVNHVETNRDAMFQSATENVRGQLAIVCSELEDDLRTKIDQVITEMTSEYKLVIIGKDLAKASQVARDQVSFVLSRTNDLFRIDVSNNMYGFQVKNEGGKYH